jgi:hypothetical protein
MINEANQLKQTPIIDCRGPDVSEGHDAYRAFALRARLDREHGTHANQLIWEGPVGYAGTGDEYCVSNGFTAMDQWLTAVEKRRKLHLAAREDHRRQARRSDRPLL